jgi:hypothetical protein
MERFTTQENMDMLFGILNSSNPELNPQNRDILQIFNNTLNSVIKVYPNSSLIEMNKIFLKTMMDTIELHFNKKQNEKPKTVYRNKEEEQKSRQNEFNKKFEQQQRNFGSFNKKRPDEIDFSDNGEMFGQVINIDKTLEQRASELKKITQNYDKKSEIQKNSWLNKDVVNLKISDTIIPIEPILLDKKTKEEKKVRFKIEEDKTKLTNFLSKISKNRITKESNNYSFDTEERIKKLEGSVSEIRNLIKEVLENSKKN